MVGIRRLSAIAGVLPSLVAPPALATSVFVATPEGDWFDGASWSTNAPPTTSDAAVIDNGGTAVASSASPLYPTGTPVEAAGLAVGSRTDPSMPVDASGAVQLTTSIWR